MGPRSRGVGGSREGAGLLPAGAAVRRPLAPRLQEPD